VANESEKRELFLSKEFEIWWNRGQRRC